MTEAVAPRLVRALAGRCTGEAAPPLTWTGEGSIVLRASALLRSPVRVVGGLLDAIAAPFSARPLLVVAAAAVVAPIARIILPDGAGAAVALAVGCAAVLALLVGAASALHEGAELRIVLRALVAGALLRAAYAVAISAAGGFPDERSTYHPIAADAASCWTAGGPSTMSGNIIVFGRATWFYALSSAYWLLEPDLVVGRALGAAFGLAAALVAGEVARALAGRRAAALAVVLLALHPEHAFWSATVSRDALTTLLVLTALALHLRRPGKLLAGRILLVAIPLGLLALNSFLVAGVLGATIALSVLCEAIVSARGAARIAAVGASVVVAAAALVFVGERYGAWFTPEMFTAVRGAGIGTNADFLPDLELSTWLGVAAFLPLGALWTLTAPWPWDAVHAHRAAYGVLALIGVAITVAGVVGLVAAARRRPGAAAPVVVFSMLLLAFLAVLEGNSGILVRHRLPLTACLACGAAALLAGRRAAP